MGSYEILLRALVKEENKRKECIEKNKVIIEESKSARSFFDKK